MSVGTGSTILPGVKLEEGAVGAMSFVKHTLEGWKIYAEPLQICKKTEIKI